MKINRRFVRIYPNLFINEMRKKYNNHNLDEYTLNLVRDHLEDRELYVPKRKVEKGKLRFTFPLYLIIMLFVLLYSGIKWFLTGNGYFNEKSWIPRMMIKWGNYSKFLH